MVSDLRERQVKVVLFRENKAIKKLDIKIKKLFKY